MGQHGTVMSMHGNADHGKAGEARRGSVEPRWARPGVVASSRYGAAGVSSRGSAGSGVVGQAAYGAAGAAELLRAGHVVARFRVAGWAGLRGLGIVRRGWAGAAGLVLVGTGGRAAPGKAGQARLGRVGPGLARLGSANGVGQCIERRGLAGRATCGSGGLVRSVPVWQAGQCSVEDRHGPASPGFTQHPTARYRSAGMEGKVWDRAVSRGPARQARHHYCGASQGRSLHTQETGHAPYVLRSHSGPGITRQRWARLGAASLGMAGAVRAWHRPAGSGMVGQGRHG